MRILSSCMLILIYCRVHVHLHIVCMCTNLLQPLTTDWAWAIKSTCGVAGAVDWNVGEDVRMTGRWCGMSSPSAARHGIPAQLSTIARRPPWLFSVWTVCVLYIYLSFHLSIFLSFFLFISFLFCSVLFFLSYLSYLPIYKPVYLSTYLNIYRPISLSSTYPTLYRSSYPPIYLIESNLMYSNPI